MIALLAGLVLLLGGRASSQDGAAKSRIVRAEGLAAIGPAGPAEARREALADAEERAARMLAARRPGSGVWASLAGVRIVRVRREGRALAVSIEALAANP